jgi:predicted esterase
MVPFVPSNSLDLTDIKVLLAGGQRDPIVLQAETIRLSDILQAAGASVHVHWHKGGHELGADDIAVAQKWLSSVDWISSKVL